MDLEAKSIERIKLASEMSKRYYDAPIICTYSGGRIQTYFWIYLSGQELNLRPTILTQRSMLPIQYITFGRNFEV